MGLDRGSLNLVFGFRPLPNQPERQVATHCEGWVLPAVKASEVAALHPSRLGAWEIGTGPTALSEALRSRHGRP